jgi:hypothetical protein
MTFLWFHCSSRGRCGWWWLRLQVIAGQGTAEERKKRVGSIPHSWAKTDSSKSPSRAPGGTPALEEVDTDLAATARIRRHRLSMKKKKSADKVVVGSRRKWSHLKEKRMGLRKRRDDRNQTLFWSALTPDVQFWFLAKILTFGHLDVVVGVEVDLGEPEC